MTPQRVGPRCPVVRPKGGSVPYLTRQHASDLLLHQQQAQHTSTRTGQAAGDSLLLQQSTTHTMINRCVMLLPLLL